MAKSIMDRLDLPDEPQPTQSLIEIVGCGRLLIEHHCGVTQYTTQRICVKVKFGTVCVQGQGLSLKRMTSNQLIISGCIQCVDLERGRGA